MRHRLAAAGIVRCRRIVGKACDRRRVVTLARRRDQLLNVDGVPLLDIGPAVIAGIGDPDQLTEVELLDGLNDETRQVLSSQVLLHRCCKPVRGVSIDWHKVDCRVVLFRPENLSML